ncbi:MAG: hypothetical protein CR993_01145 [Rhodobacterales bacterium]|nr:MAG: hypothetical protein CR993_01145 [Rhodobacterales bacterium]
MHTPTSPSELRINNDGENRAKWHKMLAELAEAGWAVETDGASTTIAQTVSLIPDPAGAEPSGFAVLEALGATEIERLLVAPLPDDVAAENILIGFNWTFVEAGPYCGIARSPSRGTEGARSIRPPEGLHGKSLKELGKFLFSTDPLSRSLGLAAVNAYWNRRDMRYPEETAKGGFAALQPPGDGVIIIGGFRGATKRLPQARIVEREPKPGDIPAEEAGPAIHGAKTLIITAQTLMNASLAPLLPLAGPQTRKVLLGPSAPLCPGLLAHVEEVAATVVLDPPAIERFIRESGTMIMLDGITESRWLAR